MWFMKFDTSKKITILIWLAVLVAILANAQNCLKELLRINVKDEVTQYDQRFKKIRLSLQPCNKVGYMQDGNFDVKSFYLAQYALAPIFLIPGTEAALIVADLDNTDDYQQFCQKQKSITIQRFW